MSNSAIPSWTVAQSDFLQYSWLQDTGQPFWIDKDANGNFSRAFIDVNKPLENSHPAEKWPVFREKIVDSELPLSLISHPLRREMVNFMKSLTKK